MIAILAALKDEIRPILDEMDVRETIHLRPSILFRGEFQKREIVVGHTGIGVDKMLRATDFVINHYAPKFCLNIGYCGALDPSLSLGDLVFATSVIHEPAGDCGHNVVLDTQTLEKIKAACAASGAKLHEGIMLSVDKVISTPHEKAYLGTKFGAVACDMESSGMAIAAARKGIPFAVVRSVLDPMDMHLPDPQMVSENGTTGPFEVIAGVISKPKTILAMPQLRFCASRARESLMRFVNEYIR